MNTEGKPRRPIAGIALLLLFVGLVALVLHLGDVRRPLPPESETVRHGLVEEPLQSAPLPADESSASYAFGFEEAIDAHDVPGRAAPPSINDVDILLDPQVVGEVDIGIEVQAEKKRVPGVSRPADPRSGAMPGDASEFDALSGDLHSPALMGGGAVSGAGGAGARADGRARLMRGHTRAELQEGFSLSGRVGGELLGAPMVEHSTERYLHHPDNAFRQVAQHPYSTFSADVNTASYTNTRRFLQEGRLPPADAVRTEQMINYFRYAYAPPEGGETFAVHAGTVTCPWAPEHHLVRIGIRAKDVDLTDRPPANLVYLVDVSGSMSPSDRLPLVKQGLRILTENLRPGDTVGLVVYAGRAERVLEPTGDADAILAAINRLESGGSTAGGAGIQMAYDMAQAHVRPGAINRVILCTDGDFNVGINNTEDLKTLIAAKAKEDVFLSVLGFGRGNLRDDICQTLAQNGNGQYVYVDRESEAVRVFSEQLAGTLLTVAKDLKFQIEFNPRHVSAYRLIGYESRILRDEDFNDDKKDAGDVGAGHTVTALYEVVPVGVRGGVDPLRYQPTPAASAPEGDFGDELLLVKIRHKTPEGKVSTRNDTPVHAGHDSILEADPDFRLAVSAAIFGMGLRGTLPEAHAMLAMAALLAEGVRGVEGITPEEQARRAEYIGLLKTARSLLEARAAGQGTRTEPTHAMH